MHRPRGENFEAQDKVRATSDRLKIRWPSPLILCSGEFTIASVQPYSHPCRTWCVKFLKFFLKLQPLESFYMKHIKCWEVSNNCQSQRDSFRPSKCFLKGVSGSTSALWKHTVSLKKRNCRSKTSKTITNDWMSESSVHPTNWSVVTLTRAFPND